MRELSRLAWRPCCAALDPSVIESFATHIIATHIMAFEGGSRVVVFEGNYGEFEADKKKRPGEEAAKPHRVRYKALMQ